MVMDQIFPIYQYNVFMHNQYDAQFFTRDIKPSDDELSGLVQNGWEVKMIDAASLTSLYESGSYNDVAIPKIDNIYATTLLTIYNRSQWDSYDQNAFALIPTSEQIRIYSDAVKFRFNVNNWSWHDISKKYNIGYRAIQLILNPNKDITKSVLLSAYNFIACKEDLDEQSLRDEFLIDSIEILNLTDMSINVINPNLWNDDIPNIGWRLALNPDMVVAQPGIKSVDNSDNNNKGGENVLINISTPANYTDGAYNVKIISKAGKVYPDNFIIDGLFNEQQIQFQMPSHYNVAEIIGLTEKPIQVHVFGDIVYPSQHTYRVELLNTSFERLPNCDGYLKHNDIVIVRGKESYSIEQSRVAGQFDFLKPC